MKKLLALALVVFGLAACQTEPEGLDVNMGGEQEVMLTVSLPEATRANSANGFQIADLGSTYDLRYILEVYRADDEGNILYENCQRQVKLADAATMSFPVRLAPEYNYQIVAWADIVDNGSYNDRIYKTDNGLDAVEIIESMWKPMDETRDAYTAVKVVNDFNSSSNLDMTLTRPFAKLRVVATDIDDIRKVGLEPTSATVEYSQDMYFKYNAVADIENEGAANDAREKSHTFTYPATPVYDDATGEYTLFADYIFVPESGTAKFLLNVYADANGSKLIKENSFSTDIFVERNKLTTIKGDVLTIGGDVKVTVDNELGVKEVINIVDTANSLIDAIEDAEPGKETNIELGGDIDLNDLLGAGILSTRTAEPTYGLLIPADKSIVLDLKGFTISQSKECTASYSMIQNNGNLTIIDSSEAKSGKISFKDTSAGDPTFGWGSYTLLNEGTLVVENGTIEHLGEQNDATGVKHMYCAIFQYSGSTTINGGTISTPTYRSVRLWKGNMTINGGNLNGQVWVQAVDNSSNLTINGGTFAPCGADGSSIFITNGDYEVQFAVTGGFFNTKIGCTDATKAGAKGCIVGGTFTATAIENTNAALIANGHAAVDNGDGTYNVINLRGSEVEIYGLTLKPNGENSKIVVNDKEGFENLTKLFNDWTDLFTDGNGTTYTNYANGAGVDYYYAGRWTVSLEADIDLNNANISPIIIKHPVSAGSPAFEGNNHTIKNAKIVTDTATENEAGLFVSSSCGFNNLKLDNIHVTGSNVGGSTAGVLAGSNNIGIDNITITNSSVEGGKYTGGVVGYGYTDVTNCTLTNVSVKGGYKLGGLIGYICASGNTREVTGNTLTECSVDGIGNGIYAGGKSEYIIGMLVGNYNCDGTCKDNVVYDMTTTANKIIGKIEAGKVVNESNNIVTYVVENYEEFEAAAKAGGNIALGADIEFTETIAIPAEGNVTIDLKGHNITSNIAGKPSESFELFSVNGNLEIKGNGTISLTSEDFEWNTSYRYTAINIRETGVVTLGNGVSVICEASKDGSYGMSYAVDIYTTGTLYINGASLHSNYIAVRCFYGNSVVYVNSGSKITSSRNNYGIWLQSSPGAVVTIADGVNYTFENDIYCFN